MREWTDNPMNLHARVPVSRVRLSFLHQESFRHGSHGPSEENIEGRSRTWIPFFFPVKYRHSLSLRDLGIVSTESPDRNTPMA